MNNVKIILFVLYYILNYIGLLHVANSNNHMVSPTYKCLY